MTPYRSLPGSSSLPSQQSPAAALPAPPDEEAEAAPLLQASGSQHRRGPGGCWPRFSLWPSPPPPPQASGYLTLIPLSDSRLRPRRTLLLVTLSLLFTLAVAAGIFFMVPRGISVGSITVAASRMSFNSNTSSYQVLLAASLPIYNPNYWSITLDGSLAVLFYDQTAGEGQLGPWHVPPRALPQVVQVQLDASHVPSAFLPTIYVQCFTFPQKLIFFLAGGLKAHLGALGVRYDLPKIANYFVLDCEGGDSSSAAAVADEQLAAAAAQRVAWASGTSRLKGSTTQT